jgi:hypothetical protein
MLQKLLRGIKRVQYRAAKSSWVAAFEGCFTPGSCSAIRSGMPTVGDDALVWSGAKNFNCPVSPVPRN